MMKNQNFPKCVNCLQNNCDSGEVNHDTRNKNLVRAECLFNCGCTKFVESKLPRTKLEELHEQSNNCSQRT